MVTAKIRIPYTYGGSIKIKPIFDVHAGNVACDIKEFKKYLAEGNDDDTWFIGGGDLMDSIITSDLKRYQKSSDATKGDEVIDEQVETMRDLLLPYKDKIIGLGIGNHEENITKRCGTNPMKRLCSELGVMYLGYSFLLALGIYDSGNSNRSIRIVVRGHHGWGGGSRTRGGEITKYEKDMGKWDADIFIYGHGHKKQADRMPRLGLQGEHLIAKPQLLVLCGTYLKTYLKSSDSTYSERAGYPPVEIGSPTIIITPGRKAGYELKADI